MASRHRAPQLPHFQPETVRADLAGLVHDNERRWRVFRLVTMAMNGWQPGEPAWWLNLQAHPDVEVEKRDGRRLVTGRAAQGEERDRLWSRWQEIDKNLDAYAARRGQPTAAVVFEPRG